MKVLLVEDNEQIQVSTRLILKRTKHVLDIANNGAEGVEMACRGRYDVCLMDINMPVMDGITATREIRRRVPYFPIIISSANTFTHRDELVKFGADDFLQKPYHYLDLRKKVNEWGETKTVHIKAYEQGLKIERSMPVDQQHAKEIKELLEKGLRKMRLDGRGCQEYVVDPDIPDKILYDFDDDNKKMSSFIDQGNKPAECKTRRENLDTVVVYLSTDEVEQKVSQEREVLKVWKEKKSE